MYVCMYVMEKPSEGSRSNFYVRESAVLELTLLLIYSPLSQETELPVVLKVRQLFQLVTTGAAFSGITMGQ